MTRPWMQFHTRDWLDNKELRRCSTSARAILTDLMCLAHEGEPYGYLADKAGPLTIKYMASRCVVTSGQFLRGLAELKQFGRIAEGESSVLFIPRMVEDERVRLARASGGSKSIGHPNTHPPKEQKGTHEGYPSGDPYLKIDSRACARADSDSISSVVDISKKQVEAKKSPTSTRFDEFWAKYPRKTGHTPAMGAWNSVVTEDNVQAVMDCLDRYLASAEVQEGKVQYAGPSAGKQGWIFSCSDDDWQSDWPRAPSGPVFHKTRQQENADAWDRA